MVMQKGKSSFDLNAAIGGHAADETKYTQDFSNLPAGIVGGIARLSAGSLGTYKPGTALAGQRFIRLAGSVCEPLTVRETVKRWEDDGTKDGRVVVVEERDVRVKGLQTSVVLPLCDTPAKGKREAVSADDNVAAALNKVREVAGPDCLDGIQDENDLEARLKAIAEAGPYFRFGTRASQVDRNYPEQRAFEQWFSNQGLEDYQPEEGGTVVERAAPSGNGHAAAKDDPEPAATSDDEPVLADLLAVANDDDAGEEQTKAQQQLKDLAEAKGIDVDSLDDWNAVVEAIEAAGDGAAEPEPAKEEPKDDSPTKGGIYKMHVKDGRTNKPKIDPKTKRPLKPIEVEVMTINNGKKTCTVLSNVDRKTRYNDVGWDELK